MVIIYDLDNMKQMSGSHTSCTPVYPFAGEVDIKITPMTAIHKSSYTKPPAKASRVLAMYLPLSSDPSYASPNDYLGPIAKIPGFSNINKPVAGCNPLADGSPSNYCWTINWVPFK